MPLSDLKFIVVSKSDEKNDAIGSNLAFNEANW